MHDGPTRAVASKRQRSQANPWNDLAARLTPSLNQLADAAAVLLAVTITESGLPGSEQRDGDLDKGVIEAEFTTLPEEP